MLARAIAAVRADRRLQLLAAAVAIGGAAIAWWTILAGNLLASGVMLGYFLRGHRVAWGEFLHAHE